jgi:hypothetical protein
VQRQTRRGRQVNSETFKVLYLFAGKKRKGSVAEFLKKKSKSLHVRTEIFEYDILRRKSIDLSRRSIQQSILRQITEGSFDAVLASPPCSTFSRATYSNKLGPRPVRSFKYPRGFSWLRWNARRQAQLGNILADFALDAILLQFQNEDGLGLLEQPEDLGTVHYGPYAGSRPASVWQFPKVQEILQLPAVHFGAFHQASFGTEYPKPTRILFRLSGRLDPRIHYGPPQFDSDGSYTGPLPRCETSTTTLARRSSDKTFRTTGTAAWPAALCEWIADELILMAQDIAEVGYGSSPSHNQELEENKSSDVSLKSSVSFNLTGKLDGRLGGFGSCRMCFNSGKLTPFHDGFGLNSPGRWDPDQRNLPSDAPWLLIRSSLWSAVLNSKGSALKVQRLCFAMTKKSEDPFGPELITLARRLLADWCVSNGSSWTVTDLLTCAEGQPFPLKLIHEILRFVGDADYEFLLQAEIGLPVGVLNHLPRTPAVYEEQTEWRLEDDPTVNSVCWASNYSSASEHQDYIREHFAEEVSEGLMTKVLRSDADRLFGKHLSVAALAVLVDEVTGKKRIIHDGSNKVRVNHKIKSLDKIRMPGPKEKFYLLKGLEDHRSVALSILSDVSKAHRRFKHCQEEHGYLACQIDEKDDHIFVNKVGTFGISSAAYWWGRVFGAAGRATHYLLGPLWTLELLAYADDLEAVGVGCNGREAMVMAYLILCALGVPFKWPKLRGGMQVDWIGLRTDYGSFQLGLSASRAAWLSSWCSHIATTGFIDPRIFTSGLGRLCFAAGTLHWEKPFLGPLYAWQASIKHLNHQVKIPWAVAFILKWIADKLSSNLRLQKAPRISPGSRELFRTDARATESGAWIGGWETLLGEDTQNCRWFAVQVEESWAPWLFSRNNNPKRLIAALELLATLVAIIFFSDDWDRNSMGWCSCSGATDNQGNSFVVSKLMSTKFPLTLLLMELAEQLRSRGLELHLTWLPRELNQPADDLSNMCFDKFKEANRIHVVGTDIKFLVMHELARESQLMFENIKAVKSKRQLLDSKSPPEPVRSKKSKLESW